MATNQTEFLGLNQWVPSDRPQMVEFNQDNENMDRWAKELSDQVGDFTADVQGQVDAFTTGVQERIDTFTADVNGRFDTQAAAVQSRFDTLEGAVNSTITGLTDDMSARIEELNTAVGGVVRQTGGALDATATCADGVFVLAGLPAELPEVVTVRFVAPADYTAGDLLQIGVHSIAVFGIDGEAPADGAFVSGALVSMDIDLSECKAYVASGGANAKVFSFTLTAAGWSGSAVPYTQTVNVAGIAADSSPGIGFQQSYTPAQFAAYVDCGVAVYSLGDGTITFRAHNSKPNTNIPLFAKVGG